MTGDEAPAAEETSDELLGRLAHELSLLVRSDLELAAAERGPELRRVGFELAATLAAAVALLLAFAALSVAAEQGLAQVMPTWCASLVVAGGWGLVAVLLLLLFDHPRRLVRRFSEETSAEALTLAMHDRSEAEQAVKATAEGLGRAVAREAAERELRAGVSDAEHLVGGAGNEAEDLLKELLVALLAPGKAGLSLLERAAGGRGTRRLPPRG